MMTQAATDEDGVSWIDDTSGADNVAPIESSNLTPAEVWLIETIFIFIIMLI